MLFAKFTTTFQRLFSLLQNSVHDKVLTEIISGYFKLGLVNINVHAKVCK